MTVALIAQVVGAVVRGRAGVEQAWRFGLYAVTALAIGALILSDSHLLFGGAPTESAGAQARSDLLASALAKWAGYCLLALTTASWILLAVTSAVAKWSNRRSGVSTSTTLLGLV